MSKKNHWLTIFIFLLLSQAGQAQLIGGIYTESSLASKAFHIINKEDLRLLGTINGGVQLQTNPDYGPSGVFVIESGPDDGHWWTLDIRFFHIKSLTTGKYITVNIATAGAETTLEDRLPDSNPDAQQFRLVAAPASSGWYKLRSRTGNLVLEVRESDGRLIVDTPKAGESAEQKFAFNLDLPDDPGVKYAVVGDHHHDYLSDGGIKADQAPVSRIRRANPSVYWNFIPTGQPGIYYLRNDLTQQYMFSTGDEFKMSPDFINNAQYKWELTTVYQSEIVQIRNLHNNKYIGTPPGSTTVVPQIFNQQNTLWILYRIDFEEPVVEEREFDDIADSPKPNRCFIGFGPTFKAALAERVGLPAEATYFPFIQDALAYYTGLADESLTDYIERIDLSNNDHRTILALAIRQYLTEYLGYLPRNQWSASDEAAVQVYEQRIQELRVDYSNRLQNSYEDFVANELGSNDGSVTMSFFVENIETSNFQWPSSYPVNSDPQAAALGDYIQGARAYNLRQPILPVNGAGLTGEVLGIGISIGIQTFVNSAGSQALLNLIWNVSVSTNSLALSNFVSFMISNVGSIVTVAAIATEMLVQQVMNTIDVQEFQQDITAAVIANNLPVHIDQTMIGNNLLAKLKLLDDIDYVVGVPAPNEELLGVPVFQDYLYHNNDNLYAPPFTVQCPNATVQLEANGQVTIDEQDIFPTPIFPPICGGPLSYTFTKNTFFCSDLGENTVGIIIYNEAVSNTCNVTVTVTDDTAPTAACQSLAVQLDQSGQANITAQQIDNGSIDGCGIPSLGLSKTNFNCNDVGVQTVTLSASDGAGNTNSCTANVTVEDNVGPTALCQNLTIQLDENGQATLTVNQVDNGSFDACGIATIGLSQTDFDCSQVGANFVTLNLVDIHGNTGSCTATVLVQDLIAPQAECQNLTIQLDQNGQASITAEAIDNGSSDACGIIGKSLSQSVFNCDDVGSNTVTLTITDANNNENTCISTVVVEDNIAPNPVCQNPSVFLQSDGTFTLTDEMVLNLEGSYDNCGAMDVIDIDPPLLTCEDLGTYVQTVVTVNDANGNVGQCTAQVYVDKGTALPIDWEQSSIGQSSGEAFYDPCELEFTIESSGTFNLGTDAHHWAYQELCGDMQIIVHIKNIDNPGWAGIEIRESLAPNAKMANIKTSLGNVIQRTMRTTSGGYASMGSIFRPGQSWLKLVRSGNYVIGYSSADGINWSTVLYVPMNFYSCAYVGLFTENTAGNTLTTGVFDHVSINGSSSGNGLQQAPETGLPMTDQAQVENATLQAYPNPFTYHTNIQFTLPETENAHLEIFDLRGRVIQNFDLKQFEPGTHTIQWNGLDDTDERLASGIYVIRLRTDHTVQTLKVNFVNE